MYSISGGEIPAVGKVELAWVQTPASTANLTNKADTGKQDGDEDTGMGDGDAMAQVEDFRHQGEYSKEQPENIDYDVADDNDWAIQ